MTCTDPRRRRSDLEVLRDVLRAIREEEIKTRIMYKANLSFAMTQRHLERLIEKGYVAAVEKRYELTPRGHALLGSLAGVTRIVQDLGLVAVSGSARGLLGPSAGLLDGGRPLDGLAETS